MEPVDVFTKGIMVSHPIISDGFCPKCSVQIYIYIYGNYIMVTIYIYIYIMYKVHIYIYTPLYGNLNSQTQISDANTTILLHFHGDSNSSVSPPTAQMPQESRIFAYPGNMDIQKTR